MRHCSRLLPDPGKTNDKGIFAALYIFIFNAGYFIAMIHRDGNEDKYQQYQYGITALANIKRSKRMKLKSIECQWRGCNQRINGDTKFKKCKGCKMVRYCSRKCQKLDWKLNHKHICHLLLK